MLGSLVWKALLREPPSSSKYKLLYVLPFSQAFHTNRSDFAQMFDHCLTVTGVHADDVLQC